jgi:TatD DNase family protein
MLVDSHCHLDRLKLEKIASGTLDTVIQEALDNGVAKMLCVGIDMQNAQAVKTIAETYPNVYASVGVHPLDVKEMITAEELIAAADHPRVVAIGETGLDYYYSQDSKAVQHESLVMHLQVAKQLKQPVIIHTRDAREDTIAILKEYACREYVGVLHCFTESWEMAKAALDLGFYISFSGIVTFKNATEIQEVAKKMPLDRILVETDSPYLAPTPHRGKPNFPKYTREVAEFVAQLKQVSYEELAQQTTDNFHRLFYKAL